jgi:hypothetical protein
MIKIVALLLQTIIPLTLISQNVGIGTIAPTARLHVNGSTNELAVFNSSSNSMYLTFSENGIPRGYIGSFAGNPEDVDFGTYGGSAGKLQLMTLGTARLTVANNGNVGIGVVNPQLSLSVIGGMNIDEANQNDGTYTRMLRFGFASGEGIGSKRTAGINQFGLDFYTNFIPRMTINQIGQVGIGTNQPQQYLSVAGGMNIDQDNSNDGTLFNALTFGNNSTTGIASWRGSAFPHNGLDFYTNGKRRFSILSGGAVCINPIEQDDGTFFGPGLYFGYPSAMNGIFYWNIPGEQGLQLWSMGNKKIHMRNDIEISDDVRITGDLHVWGEGVVRSSNSDQLMIKTVNVNVNTSINANSTIVINFTWADAFTAVPVAYVGNALAGSSNGWAEVVMSIAHLTTTGGTLFIFNPRNSTANPNYTVSLIGIGRD